VSQADQRTCLRNLDAQFLVEFAPQGPARIFARLDLAAREFPLAGIDLVRRPLADEDFALRVAQRAGGDVDEPTCGTQR